MLCAPVLTPKLCPTAGWPDAPPHPSPSLPLSPRGSCTSGLSGASAGSRWQEDSACGTAGNAAHGVGGCCWVGRGLCTAIAAPSPALRCTCGRRVSQEPGHPGALPSVQAPEQTYYRSRQNQTVLLSVAMHPCQGRQSPVHGVTGLPCQNRKPRVIQHCWASGDLLLRAIHSKGRRGSKSANFCAGRAPEHIYTVKPGLRSLHFNVKGRPSRGGALVMHGVLHGQPVSKRNSKHFKTTLERAFPLPQV